MSEEAKEKAGGGKAAHRKKKGKKVREWKSFLCLCAPHFAQLLLCYKGLLCVCMGGRRLLNGLKFMGEAGKPITKVSEAVFDHLLSLLKAIPDQIK